MLNFLKNLSPLEIGIIAAIILILFGAGMVTRLARTGGQTFKEMKNIKKTFNEALEDDTKEPSENKG